MIPRLYETVLSRKSVRSFDGRSLTGADRENLLAYIGGMTDPFGVPVRFVLLDAEEHGLSSPVLTGEKLYVAGMVEKAPQAELAYGYAFEQLLLCAWSMGIGSVWIGGTMKRETFQEAAGLGERELMPCVSPLGYPAKKRSLRETVMRKGVGADSRKPASELFFSGDFSTPLALTGSMARIVEMVRWAPSAVNKQPWRIVLRDGLWHFFEKRDRGFLNEATGDLQRIDLGIALCHFLLGAEDAGLSPALCTADPKLALPEDTEYVISVSL